MPLKFSRRPLRYGGCNPLALMDNNIARTLVPALALGATLLVSGVASAQNNVVVPQQPAPAQPAPAQAAPAQPAPNNVVVSPGVTQSQAPSTTVAAEPVVVAPEHSIHPETRPNRFLLMSGLVIFGAPYVASVGIGAASHHDGDGNLVVPLAGPWIDLAQRPQCPSNTDCTTENVNRGALIADGVVQTIGALEILGSFVFPQTVDVASIHSKDETRGIGFTPSKVGPSGYGLSAVGFF